MGCVSCINFSVQNTFLKKSFLEKDGEDYKLAEMEELGYPTLLGKRHPELGWLDWVCSMTAILSTSFP